MKKILLFALLLSCFAGCSKPATTPTDVTPVDIGSSEVVSAPAEESDLAEGTDDPTSQAQTTPVSSTPEKTEPSVPEGKDSAVTYKQPDQRGNCAFADANEALGAFALVCSTYEEYQAFLNGNQVDYNTNKEERMASYLTAYPKEYFAKGNSILLYYLHSDSGVRDILVDGITFDNGVLSVTMQDRFPSEYSKDWVSKLYVCELLNFSKPINKVHITSKVWEARVVESGRSEWVLKETQQFDFPA